MKMSLLSLRGTKQACPRESGGSNLMFFALYLVPDEIILRYLGHENKVLGLKFTTIRLVVSLPLAVLSSVSLGQYLKK